MKKFRILVVGGGPVGLAFALAASRLRDVEVVVVERAATDTPALPSTHFDHRVYALAPTSIALLESIGVWPRIASARITPIDQMRVFADAEQNTQSEQAPLPEIEFGIGAPLAHIVEHAVLMEALHQGVGESAIVFKPGERVAAMETTKTGRRITLASGEILDADLLIAADGRQSQIRQFAGIDVVEKDYASDGVVANFVATKPHGNIARQWFSPEGVLAYLPLPDNQISIVWSVAHAFATKLGALDDARFAERVADAGGHALGVLTLASPRDAVPLKRLRALQWVKPALALIGDAAHAVHPLAGQGANLGFGDVSVLVDILASRSAMSRIGDLALLRRYARARIEAAVAMAETTDRLHGLFLSEAAVAKWLRRQGFGWFNRAAPIKRLATEYAIRA